MYVTHHLSFQDQLHSLNLTHKKKRKQKKTNKNKKKKNKKKNVVGTPGSNQHIAN